MRAYTIKLGQRVALGEIEPEARRWVEAALSALAYDPGQGKAGSGDIESVYIDIAGYRIAYTIGRSFRSILIDAIRPLGNLPSTAISPVPEILIGPVDDAQIARASELMEDWNRTCGTPEDKKVCIGIHAAVGIEHFSDLVVSWHIRDAGWRWLLAVATVAATRRGGVVMAGARQIHAYELISRIFAFTWMWNVQVAPNLEPENYLFDLSLPRSSDELVARLGVIAMPHLLLHYGELWDQPVFSNQTGNLLAREVICGGAARAIVDYRAGRSDDLLPSWIPPEQYAQAERLSRLEPPG